MDAATQGRVQLVCDFVNAQVVRARGRIIVVGLACAIVVVLLPLLLPVYDLRILVALGGGAFALFSVRARGELAASYADLAMKRLVAALGRQLTYRPESSLTREQFQSMQLFETPSRWEATYEVRGAVNGTPFSLHPVSAPGDARGSTVFDGVIIRIDFTRPFATHTVVVPDSVQATAATAWGCKEIVMLLQPAFERLYTAWSTEYMRARAIFTPRLIQCLMTAAGSFHELRLAFVNRFVFVAVPGATMLPVVSLFGERLTPWRAAGQLTRLVTLAESVAAALTGD